MTASSDGWLRRLLFSDEHIEFPLIEDSLEETVEEPLVERRDFLKGVASGLGSLAVGGWAFGGEDERNAVMLINGSKGWWIGKNNIIYDDRNRTRGIFFDRGERGVLHIDGTGTESHFVTRKGNFYEPDVSLSSFIRSDRVKRREAMQERRQAKEGNSHSMKDSGVIDMKADPRNAIHLFSQHLEQHDYRAAEEILEKVFKIEPKAIERYVGTLYSQFPDDKEIVLAKGIIMYLDGDYSNARQVIAKLYQKNKDYRLRLGITQTFEYASRAETDSMKRWRLKQAAGLGYDHIIANLRKQASYKTFPDYKFVVELNSNIK